MEPFCFNHITNFNISDIKALIGSYTTEWEQDISRQKLFPNHKNTKTIFITDFPLEWTGQGYPLTIKNTTDLYYLTLPIVQYLETFFEGKVGRSLYVKLCKGTKIPLHNDMGYYLENAHRCHIPIITDPGVTITVGEYTEHIPESACVEINNNLIHGVSNDSDIDRVHLIVDIVPNKYFLPV